MLGLELMNAAGISKVLPGFECDRTCFFFKCELVRL